MSYVVSSPVWQLPCVARGCEKVWESDMNLNWTMWDMQAAGWMTAESGKAFPIAYCPDHLRSPHPDQMWVVECIDCDWSEEFADADEAKEEADEHTGHYCSCDWCETKTHFVKVLSPADQAARAKRFSDFAEKAAVKRQEEQSEERYVAFLIQRDQESRRDMQHRKEKVKEVEPVESKHMLLLGGIAILVLVAIFVMMGVGA